MLCGGKIRVKRLIITWTSLVECREGAGGISREGETAQTGGSASGCWKQGDRISETVASIRKALQRSGGSGLVNHNHEAGRERLHRF